MPQGGVDTGGGTDGVESLNLLILGGSMVVAGATAGPWSSAVAARTTLSATPREDAQVP